MTTGAKIGIGVGAVVFLGGVWWFIHRKRAAAGLTKNSKTTSGGDSNSPSSTAEAPAPAITTSNATKPTAMTDKSAIMGSAVTAVTARVLGGGSFFETAPVVSFDEASANAKTGIDAMGSVGRSIYEGQYRLASASKDAAEMTRILKAIEAYMYTDAVDKCKTAGCSAQQKNMLSQKNVDFNNAVSTGNGVTAAFNSFVASYAAIKAL